MSRSGYIGKNEPAKLMNLFSTIDRGRGITKLWLVGNTITKVCPYLVEWDLLSVIRNMKQGDIKEKWIKTGEVDENGIAIEVKLAFEYCGGDNITNFVIGAHSEMINKGEWQVDMQPHLPKSLNEYKSVFKMIMDYKSFKFIAEYLVDLKYKYGCWFIKPYNGEIKDKTLVFSDKINVSPYYQRDIYNPLINNHNLRELLQTFKESNIFYASDEVGTDFKQAIDFEIRK